MEKPATAQSSVAPLLVRTSRPAIGSESRQAERLCNVGMIEPVQRQAHELADRTAGETDSESALHQGVDAQYVAGSTGAGKTWIACAFAQQACRQGFSALYVRAARLFEELRIAHGDGSFTRRLAQLAKIDVLLLDDWGLQELDQSARNDLLEVIDDRVCSRSTIITSQLPLEHWHAWLQDPTLADAILDRLVHQAHRLPIRPTLDFNAICDGRLVLV